jgi:hypothetical protein
MQSSLSKIILGIRIRTLGQALFDGFNVPLFGSLNNQFTLRLPAPHQQHGCDSCD